MFTLTEILIYALAVWRVSSMFVHEDGPAYLFRTIREKTGIRHDGDGTPTIVPETFAAQVFNCVWCFSVWVSFLWTAFWLVSPEWSLKFAVPFAFSAGAILIDALIEKLR